MSSILTVIALRDVYPLVSSVLLNVTGRAVVGVATTNERVYNFVGREMLQGGIAALAHPIFTTAETLQLIRDILAQQLATSPGPRQVSFLVTSFSS